MLIVLCDYYPSIGAVSYSLQSINRCLTRCAFDFQLCLFLLYIYYFVWYTDQLILLGTMVVNGGEAVVGSSPGKLMGLDLVAALYLGGVPDFAQLPVEAGYTSGLRGCISRLIISNTRNYDFIREAREKVNTLSVYHSCTS